MTHEVEIITIPSRTVAVTRFHVGEAELGTIGERMGQSFHRVIAHLARLGVTPGGPAIARYEPAGEGFDVAAGFVVEADFAPAGDDDVDLLVLPGGEVAHTTHIGAYERLPEAYEALRAEITRRGLAFPERGPMWEEYWTGPETAPEETRTEVYWPVDSGATSPGGER
jgi:effector-binding domain-containing protein